MPDPVEDLLPDSDPIEDLQTAVAALGDAFLSDDGVLAVPSVFDHRDEVVVLASEDATVREGFIAHAIVITPALLERLMPIANGVAHRFTLRERDGD